MFSCQGLFSRENIYSASRHCPKKEYRMNKSIMLLCAASLPLLLSACVNSQAIERSDREQFVTEFYALVGSVSEVRFKSYVGPAMAVGALDGALSNVHYDSDAIIGGAIVGALFGGILTVIFEGSNRGYEYQLEATDGDLVTVIVGEKPASIGECVNVRVSGNVSISKQAMFHCETQSEL
jgi:hypothetical protein